MTERGPVALPVNYRMLDDDIVLLEAHPHAPIGSADD
jgi:hypothetical protein